MDLAELTRLDRALIELVTSGPSRERVEAVADAWVWLDGPAQATKLRYFRKDTKLGWHLRAALWTASANRDLGALQAELDAAKGHPW